MFDSSQYQLLDFGQGRVLERFGNMVIDRPCAAAGNEQRVDRKLWETVHFRFTAARNSGPGSWTVKPGLTSKWYVTLGTVQFELKLAPSGQIGLFPEQAENWDWIARQCQRASRPLSVLNLFAYTGGSTLAAAAAGANVVHVDAARGSVAWARRNAAHSGLDEAPIRWITEGARTFVQRELKRGNTYDAVILDPPSYGHGRKNEVWQLSEHLMPMLRDCAQLTRDRRAFMLLTCHTPGFDAPQLAAYMSDAVFGHCQADPQAGSLPLHTKSGRRLPAGFFCRWPG